MGETLRNLGAPATSSSSLPSVAMQRQHERRKEGRGTTDKPDGRAQNGGFLASRVWEGVQELEFFHNTYPDQPKVAKYHNIGTAIM